MAGRGSVIAEALLVRFACPKKVPLRRWTDLTRLPNLVQRCVAKQGFIERKPRDESNIACYVRVFTSSSRERR